MPVAARIAKVRRPRRSPEHQKLAHEAVQPGKSEGRQGHHEEQAGRAAASARQAAHLAEVPGMEPIVEHPHQEEQRPRREPVVHHLDDAPRHPLKGSGEDPQDHEPEVRHAGVGHQALEIALDKGHHGAVDDPDDRQRQDELPEVVGGLGEQDQVEADQPVGPDLQEDAGQDDRPRRRRLGMGVGEPGVEREQRDLHGERHEERQEEHLAVTAGRSMPARAPRSKVASSGWSSPGSTGTGWPPAGRRNRPSCKGRTSRRRRAARSPTSR